MNMIFDEIIDRRGTNAYKTDLLTKLYGRDDLIPLWVADMDFKTPDCIVEALKERFKHEVYGYSLAPDSYWESIINWVKELHGWEISREELSFIPGIVKGIAYVLQCFTLPGDGVIIQPPVYMPFIHVPNDTGRKLLLNPLIRTEEGYEMDLEGLEEICRTSSPKILILCNPHNPAGIVWSSEVLAGLAHICSKYGVIVISDEIHADMALFDNVHTPFPMASEEARNISITFAAPTKTFNIAGLVSSYCVVHNRELREPFYGWLNANHLASPTFIAAVATEAAFTKGGEWRRQMLDYVEGNVRFVEEFLSKNIPGIRAVRPQASFLIWLDCRELGFDQEALKDLFINKARLALNDGEAFGKEGSGYMRLNVGCPRAVLSRAMEQLDSAVREITR
ncbi:MAG: putative C-S lyase [Bacteroidales bacterium]|nr:putative C-S lyase [Bacteroidales bacterium]